MSGGLRRAPPEPARPRLLEELAADRPADAAAREAEDARRGSGAAHRDGALEVDGGQELRDADRAAERDAVSVGVAHELEVPGRGRDEAAAEDAGDRERLAREPRRHQPDSLGLAQRLHGDLERLRRPGGVCRAHGPGAGSAGTGATSAFGRAHCCGTVPPLSQSWTARAAQPEGSASTVSCPIPGTTTTRACGKRAATVSAPAVGVRMSKPPLIASMGTFGSGPAPRARPPAGLGHLRQKSAFPNRAAHDPKGPN